MSWPSTLSPGLRSVVAAEFGDDPAAADLVARSLQVRRAYTRPFVEELLALARTPGAVDDRGWARRCLAALLLQHQILLLRPEDPEEWPWLLGQLGLREGSGPEGPARASLRREGYSAREPGTFLVQFHRRLARLQRVCMPFRRRTVSPRVLADLLACARQECKLTLARYLFPADDVALRIARRVRRSEGQPALLIHRGTEAESRRALAGLPDEEARLVRRLIDDSTVSWVGDDTPARVNSLVEAPVGTVVLVVKPPGSALEIEIKRTGRRQDRPLDLVFARDGRIVTESHRLDGGSMERSLQWEAAQAARLAGIYRAIHGTEPPISRMVSLLNVNTVPSDGRSVQHIATYFQALCDPERGDAPRRIAAVYSRERSLGVPDPTEIDATVFRLIEWANPSQALLVGSSSYRLDMLAHAFAPDGFRVYRDRLPAAERAGLGQPCAEARRFADALLEEILGVYHPPRGRPRDYASYLAAAWAVPRNRARGDRAHVALAGQLGTFWGTLLAVRGFTNGESFVARNVGIRSVWRDGRWRVGLVFMDHDDMHLAEPTAHRFVPEAVVRGTFRDELHAAYAPAGQSAPATIMDHLQSIYRSSTTTARRAESALRHSLGRAYRRAWSRWEADPGLGGRFAPAFVQACRAWDHAAALYLAHLERGREEEAWRPDAREALERGGIDGHDCELWLDWVERAAPFLGRYAFLYRNR